MTNLLALLTDAPEALDALKVLLVAALPVVELRGAIPYAMGLGFPVWPAVVLGVIGNLLPVPFILALLKPVRDRLAQRGPLRPFFAWLERRALKRRGLVDRYGPMGLALFVGIPLPMTGAWTGALLAVTLDLSRRQSLWAITLGVLMAAAIIGGLSTLGFMAVGG